MRWITLRIEVLLEEENWDDDLDMDCGDDVLDDEYRADDPDDDLEIPKECD